VNNETFLDIIKEKKVTLDTGPRLLSLNYDTSCNLYCESCRDKVKVLDKKRQEELIRFQDALIKTDFFKKVKRLTVSGVGEVFASRVLMDLLTDKITKSRFPGLKIMLRTNGILLTPGNWERIKNVHYAIDTISISIDAAAENTYRLLRRGGDFNRLLKNLGFLKELKKKNNIKVILNFVVQKQNYREMPGFVRLAKTFDCDRVAFTKIFNLGTFNSNNYHDAAIHDPRHPEFPEFKKILAGPLLKDPMVNLKNLANLME
jgi:MoaA/NifB/PqqE/SkfB family radical SAM enzyme